MLLYQFIWVIIHLVHKCHFVAGLFVRLHRSTSIAWTCIISLARFSPLHIWLEFAYLGCYRITMHICSIWLISSFTLMWHINRILRFLLLSIIVTIRSDLWQDLPWIDTCMFRPRLGYSKTICWNSRLNLFQMITFCLSTFVILLSFFTSTTACTWINTFHFH